MSRRIANPFRYGSLALDEAFTDREREIAEITADALNGQDVVVFAPRRYGKSSLIWRVAQELVTGHRALVAQVDLMTAPTPAKLATKLAQAIFDDVATPLFRAKERMRVFRGLRVSPTITVDPDDGSISFSFDTAYRAGDLADTIERLLELPARLAAERNRRVVLILDEFQEVVDIDPGLPRLMRAVFQRQPEVAHVYLGSKRHMMERIFSDANEPFWRSAKQLELGVIPPELFAGHIAQRFADSGRAIEADAIDAVLEVTGGHPYGTQELCYFLWERTTARRPADRSAVDEALESVLRSEHAHFSLVWDRASKVQRRLLQALAREPGHPFSGDYRDRHGLPSPSSVQKAVTTLRRDELVGRIGERTAIVEPFLAQWIRRHAA